MSKTILLMAGPLILFTSGIFGQAQFEFVDEVEHIRFEKPWLKGTCEPLVKKVYAHGTQFSIIFKKSWKIERPHDAESESSFDTCTVTIEASADPGYSFRWVSTEFYGEYKLVPGHKGQILVNALVGTKKVEPYRNFEETARTKIKAASLLGYPILFEDGKDTYFPCGGTFGNQLFYTLHLSGNSQKIHGPSSIAIQTMTGNGSTSSIDIPFNVFECE